MGGGLFSGFLRPFGLADRIYARMLILLLVVCRPLIVPPFIQGVAIGDAAVWPPVAPSLRAS